MSDTRLAEKKPPDVDRLGEILKRIDERLRVLNMSMRGAALKAGLSPAQIRTMRRQYEEGKQHGASDRTIRGLARALDTTPEWLVSGTEPSERAASAGGGNASTLPFAGAVAAGIWREGEAGIDQSRVTAVPPDPRYPAKYQCAYEVRGTSMDRVAQPGDFLIVVDREKLGLPLRSGDLVIISRYKKGLQEVTARRYKVASSVHEFQFESTDPRHTGVILGHNTKDNDSIHFGGVAVAIYRALV